MIGLFIHVRLLVELDIVLLLLFVKSLSQGFIHLQK